MAQVVPQLPEAAAKSPRFELKALAKDGQMTDAENESLMERLSDKKRPLDESAGFFLCAPGVKRIGGRQVKTGVDCVPELCLRQLTEGGNA